MKTTIFRSLVAACAFSLIAATAGAQQTPASSPGQQPQADQPDAEPKQDQQQESEQPRQQTEQQREEQPQEDAEQRYEARRVDPTVRTQGRMSLQDYLVKKLMLANKAEIELSQMATEKAQHPEVKQFAEMLIRDHQQFNEKLQQLSSDTSAVRRSARTGDEASRDTERRERAGRLEDRSERAGERAEQRAERRGDRPGRAATARQGERGEQRSRIGQRMRRGGAAVPQQLTRITEEACQKHLEMTKQMLQEKSGEEFDYAFVALQIGAHTAQTAELQAMKNAGSPEFQQLVSQAEQKVTEHLDRAKQLAQTLKSDRGTVGQGSETRSTDTGSTNQDSPRRDSGEQQRR